MVYSSVMFVQPPLVMSRYSHISCSSIGRSGSILQTDTLSLNVSSLTLDKSTIKKFATAILITTSNDNVLTITNTIFQSISGILIDKEGPYNVLASNNYWGTTNVGVINNRVFNYWDDIHYGEVIYTNYSSNLLPAKTGCPSL